MDILLQLFNVIVPVFVTAGIGFVLAKRGQAFDASVTTLLVSNFGTPCLVFAALVKVQLEPDALAAMGLASVLAMLGFGLFGWLGLRIAKLDPRAFLSSVMCSNSGNVGLPLCLLAFGEQGLALAVVYFTVSATVMFTVGGALASGTFSFVKILKMPFLWAVAAAFAFLATGLTPPQVVLNTTKLIGGLSIPLMLIALGISLASLKVASLPRSLYVSVLRLGIGFSVSYGLALIMGLDKLQTGVLVLQSSLPVAVFNYLFALRFNRAPEEVAGTVVLSTTMSFSSLPLLIWFLL
ncbi:MAG: AEC family transporter [Rhodospirillales bacterium]